MSIQQLLFALGLSKNFINYRVFCNPVFYAFVQIKVEEQKIGQFLRTHSTLLTELEARYPFEVLTLRSESLSQWRVPLFLEIKNFPEPSAELWEKWKSNPISHPGFFSNSHSVIISKKELSLLAFLVKMQHKHLYFNYFAWFLQRILFTCIFIF